VGGSSMHVASPAVAPPEPWWEPRGGSIVVGALVGAVYSGSLGGGLGGDLGGGIVVGASLGGRILVGALVGALVGPWWAPVGGLVVAFGLVAWWLGALRADGAVAVAVVAVSNW
jgi:hypothetical protein